MNNKNGIQLDTVIEATENCLCVPKCQDCPWETCEEDHDTVTMPRDLATALYGIAHAVKRRFSGTHPVTNVDADGIRFECASCRSLLWKQVDTASLEYNKANHRFCSFCGKAVSWDE